MSTALVFALLRQLSATPSSQWRKIIAISRRAPLLDHQDDRITFRPADLLTGPDGLTRQLRDAGAQEVTHVFFYAYIEKSDEKELVDVNEKLLSTAISAISEICKKVQVFQLQTGYKYYGTHLGGKDLAPYPWQEDSPRHKGINFYFVQEDMLKEAAENNGWKYIITRPNFIIGTSKGNFMSMAVTIALYATALKALGEPLVYPGSSISYNLEFDHSIANNNAAFQLFAALNDRAAGRIFNIHDGKPVKFADLWPKIADYFNIPLASPPADDPPPSVKIGQERIILHSAGQWAKSNSSKLPGIAKELELDPDVFQYATWDFIDFALSRTWKDLATLDEARSIGWEGCADTFEDGYKVVFDDLKRLRIIPS